MNYTPELDCRHLSKWPGFLALSLCRMGSWDFWKSVVPYAGNGMAAFCPLSAQGAVVGARSVVGARGLLSTGYFRLWKKAA